VIVKLVGEIQGAYTEQTFENVTKYRVALYDSKKGMDDGDVFRGGEADFLRLTLFYNKEDFEYVYFNTVCYLMSAEGVTVDILSPDKMLKKLNKR